MKPHLLTWAGGLGLVVGGLLWASPSRAEGFCYMIDADGQVVNLDNLCQSSSTPETGQPQTTGAEIAPAPSQDSSSSRIRSFTILGSPVDPDSSEAPSEAEDSSAASESKESVSEPGNVDNSSDIPTREIAVPQEIEVPEIEGVSLD